MSFVQENIISLGLGLVLSSIALFGAFKAGQVLERKVSLENMHDLDLTLNLLKQETEFKLSMLFSEYKERHNNVNLPEEIDVNKIIEHFINIDETLPEKILGLNQLYLDLLYNNTQSVYFADFLHYII